MLEEKNCPVGAQVRYTHILIRSRDNEAIKVEEYVYKGYSRFRCTYCDVQWEPGDLESCPHIAACEMGNYTRGGRKSIFPDLK